MSTTSMSLETLSFLLQHMDANKRFEICKRCPSLREFEKSVPLKINSLVLTESCVTVNDTAYRIGILRKSKAGETPRHIAEINEIGGVAYDVDEYGLRDESNALSVTPGDVVMSQHEEPFLQDEDNVGNLEAGIQFLEGELANLRARRPSRRNLEKIHHMEKAIEDFRGRLFEFQCRRDKIPSNYEMFLQLTKTRTVDKQEQKTVEIYEHNNKFSEAMKQMATLLLGARSSPINVTKFEISFVIPGVIRLPIGLKLRIEQLVFRAGSGTNVGVLAPILHESSFPLKKLEIGVWSDEDAANPIVKTAESLRIRDVLTNIRQAISAIANPVVRISMPTLPEQAIKILVRNWIRSQRPVGYMYIFDFYCEPCIPAEMEDILKDLNGIPVDDENVIIPMSKDTQLKVSHGPFPEFAPRSQWAVKFLTEAIEH